MPAFVATEFLSVTAQRELIAAAQDVPVSVELDEAGEEVVRYGTTPLSEMALERLTTAFLPVIDKEARRSKTHDFDDARATLLLEFVATVRRHDLDSPVPFSKTIGTILSRAMSDTDRTSDLVAIKESVASYYWRLIHKHDGDFVAAYNEAKSTPNGIAPATFLAVHNVIGGIDSLDPVLTADEGAAGLRYAASWAVESPESFVIDKALVDYLFTLEDVSDRAESVLRLVYGFSDSATETIRLAHGFRIGEELTDAQAAHVLSLSRPTAQRERVRALAVMREALLAAIEAEAAA